jgi:hypothetical protein
MEVTFEGDQGPEGAVVPWMDGWIRILLQVRQKCNYVFKKTGRLESLKFPCPVPPGERNDSVYSLALNESICNLRYFWLAMSLLLLWRNSPTRVRAVLFLRFLDHTQWLFWSRDRPVAETSTWQNTVLTIDTHPWHREIRTRNPSKRAAKDRSTSGIGRTLA